MKEYIMKVSEADSGMRLDLCLTEFFKRKTMGFSRTALQSFITSGNVTVNNSQLAKPHHKLKSGDEVRIQIEDKKPEQDILAEDIALDVVYEDDDLAVINKSSGLVVHPAPGNYEHTLVNALLGRFKKLSDINPQRPGIVHRLDKETSGLLVIAKDNAAHLDLAKQFAAHTIKRKYIALVKGSVEFDEDIIELPISRHPYKRKNMAVGFGQDSKYAKTHYRTLKRTKDFSILELEPFTGRTHQLRVHLTHLGHPILGDTRYIGFTHPRTGKFVEFSCDIPPEFEQVK
jgi:23S rRNA pseudouridine1911/1915/1917 synthase